jgi:hypothetical protein
MILEFGPSAHAHAIVVAARMARMGHADGEATWKAIGKAIEKNANALNQLARNGSGTLNPDSDISACPNCSAPISQFTLDCREFASGAIGFITCVCKKCGYATGTY